MIDFLVVQIKLGKIKIDDVPKKYKTEIENRLKAE